MWEWFYLFTKTMKWPWNCCTCLGRKFIQNSQPIYTKKTLTLLIDLEMESIATPLWGSCEVATHTLENGTWESSETLKNSEHDYRGQNTSHWDVLGTIGKVLKCGCPKWPHMSHLDICNTSYGRKKGRESNCQFDSRPLKVGNRPDSGVCR